VSRAIAGRADLFWPECGPMKKLKAMVTNPYLLGLEGFVVGALLVWASPQLIEPAQAAAAPVADVQLVPAA
jgi:hypothetical protein